MSLAPARAILYGGLTVGVLDLLDALIFFYVRSGAMPMGILHSIAAGLLGPADARAGGMATAILGFALHFAIAFTIVSVYVVSSRYLPVLRSRYVLCGLSYGVVAYFVMTYVVVPLSNARSGGVAPWPVFLNGILIHAFGVGLPAAWFASRIRARGR